MLMERCQSGRMGWFRKPLCSQGYPGFESLPLRQEISMKLTQSEQLSLDSIRIASENDPLRPEFPADDPKFPATPTYQIKVLGFTNVWLKDESYNPTGTHKDRMAWEIVVSYRELLMAKMRGQLKGTLPQMSIISSGSAATAIQVALQRYNLPNLKVLLSDHTSEAIVNRLEALGCELYKVDLSEREFTWKDILKLTDNPDGFDITSNEALDPATRFYDWLSYEIINNSPDYCFVPFGTGYLFENILNINKHQVSTLNSDPRFQGDIERLRKCNFIGATTNNPNSKADKLYSPYLPFSHYDDQWMQFYKYAGFCGSKSDVVPVKEKYFEAALSIARKQGISCEPSGIAGLALLLQMEKQVPKHAKILIVNTGNSAKIFD